MCKNVFKIACGAIICAIFFVACGDKGESSGESKAESSGKSNAIAESNATDSPTNDSTKSTDSSQTTAIQAKDSPQTTAIQAKNPKDLYKKCIACHGARGDKVAPGSAGNITIADLSKSALIADMKGYRAKTLSKGGTAAVMYLQANGLSDDDIEILGEYISNFKK